jgi:hypothetical protein
MMMPVDALKCLDRHSEIAGRLPPRHARLHQPRCARVPQDVRGHVGETSAATRRREAFLDVAEPGAVLVDDEADIGPARARSPQMA